MPLGILVHASQGLLNVWDLSLNQFHLNIYVIDSYLSLIIA